MITLKLKIGKNELTFEGNNMKDIHRFSKVWGAVPNNCTCGSDDIYLSFTQTQEGYEYCKVACKKCGATFTIKQTTKGDYYIEKGEQFKIVQPKGNSQQQNTNMESNNPYNQDNNIPY